MMSPDAGLILYYKAAGLLAQGQEMAALEAVAHSLDQQPHFKTYYLEYQILKSQGRFWDSLGSLKLAASLPEGFNSDQVLTSLAREHPDYRYCLMLCNTVLERSPTYGPAKRLLTDLQDEAKVPG